MGSKGCALHCDWWISNHFVNFVGLFFHGSLIDSSENATGGGDLNFRFRMHVIERCSNVQDLDYAAAVRRRMGAEQQLKIDIITMLLT